MVYDLVIIGGGINGAGTARDAALRGLSVALFERDNLSRCFPARKLRNVAELLRQKLFGDRIVVRARSRIAVFQSSEKIALLRRRRFANSLADGAELLRFGREPIPHASPCAGVARQTLDRCLQGALLINVDLEIPLDLIAEGVPSGGRIRSARCIRIGDPAQQIALLVLHQ